MSDLNEVLKKYAQPYEAPVDVMGADEVQMEPTATTAKQIKRKFDQNAFRHDLEAIRKGNKAYFIVCVIMGVILFLTMVGVILLNLHNPAAVKLISTGAGLSITGIIAYMLKLWRVKSNIEYLMLLAPNADDETMRLIIQVLAK